MFLRIFKFNLFLILTLNFNYDIVKLGDQRKKLIKKFREDLWKHVLKYELVVNEKQYEVDKLITDLEVQEDYIAEA